MVDAAAALSVAVAVVVTAADVHSAEVAVETNPHIISNISYLKILGDVMCFQGFFIYIFLLLNFCQKNISNVFQFFSCLLCLSLLLKQAVDSATATRKTAKTSTTPF